MSIARSFLLPIDTFHARPATRFVNLANKFQCQVRVRVNGQEVDGKSVLDLIVLQALKNDEFLITTDGADAEACLNALGSLFTAKFHEEERASY